MIPSRMIASAFGPILRRRIHGFGLWRHRADGQVACEARDAARGGQPVRKLHSAIAGKSPITAATAMEPNMIQDAGGHHLSGATAEAVAAYDRAVRAFNLVHGDAPDLFDAAIEAAP